MNDVLTRIENGMAYFGGGEPVAIPAFVRAVYRQAMPLGDTAFGPPVPAHYRLMVGAPPLARPVGLVIPVGCTRQRLHEALACAGSHWAPHPDCVVEGRR